jgi:ATP-dependent Clp protease adapter protein ClpS
MWVLQLKEAIATNQEKLNIILQDDSVALGEVVVTALPRVLKKTSVP